VTAKIEFFVQFYYFYKFNSSFSSKLISILGVLIIGVLLIKLINLLINLNLEPQNIFVVNLVACWLVLAMLLYYCCKCFFF